MNTTDASNVPALELLVAPWLPGAKVDTFKVKDSCGCYSEYTTEPCSVDLHFKAPWTGSERDLSILVGILEDSVIRPFMEARYDFNGCSCCDNRVSYWVRVIPTKDPKETRL